MPEGFDKLTGAIGDTLKTAPTIYEDSLQPTVQEVGKFVARIPRAINAAFSSLDKWILNKEYTIDETKKLLEKKLANVDPEKIVEPEPYVAVPAIQAISYSMNSEELRNLYANLLAKAMNSDTKVQVHPAYVNIISQMTPLDAKILKIVANTPDKDFPLVDIRACDNNKEELPLIFLFSNFSSIDFPNSESISLSFENLYRNNLINFTELPHSSGYDSIYNDKKYITLIEYLKTKLTPQYPDLDIVEKSCYITQFGNSFCKICIS